jgi:predicted DNA-binding protein (MmcQ/YjbR family)
MNKTHWNTVISNGIIPDNEICDMIDHSYDLIVKSLTKKQRAELGL